MIKLNEIDIEEIIDPVDPKTDQQTFSIYGASDDLIETSGIPGCDEFPAKVNTRVPDEVGRFLLRAPNGERLVIVAFYDGVWYFAPRQYEEDIDDADPTPDWPIRMKNPGHRDPEYSIMLEIDVPHGTTLTRLF